MTLRDILELEIHDAMDLDGGERADYLLAELHRHGFIILPLAKLGALEQRLSAMHDMVQAIGPALADLQAAALKDG